MDNKNKIEETKSIIQDLKMMGQYGEGVDGETMQYILQQVGMEYQMLRQLMLRMPIQQVEYLFEERKELESVFPRKPKMKTYVITETRPTLTKWTFEVKAETEQEALEKVVSGNVEPNSMITDELEDESHYDIEEKSFNK